MAQVRRNSTASVTREKENEQKQTDKIYVPKTKFYIPYPNEKDFAVQAGSSREAELTKQNQKGKTSDLFIAQQFIGLSFEQISQAIILQAKITKTDIKANKSTEYFIGFPDTPKDTIPETESKGVVEIRREFSRLNKLEEPLKKIDAKLKKNSSPETRLSAALNLLGENQIFAHIKAKYSNKNLTPTYALYCLEQELRLIKEQIKAYDNATTELGSSLQNPSSTDRTPALTFIKNSTAVANSLKAEIPKIVEDFTIQFRGIIEDVNAVEKFQTSKKVGKLVFAEKFPAIEKFKSRILTESELLEVMDGKRLSGQQADLLRQIEDVIMNDNSRSKVRGLLDTGMGKTFLAEKIAKYSEILKRAKEKRKLPSGFPSVASFEIKNIDLASQDQLLEMESRSTLKGSLIIVDEDFFISKKSLRTLVDKGAKVVRFGASENQLQLIEAFHRAEEKNIAGAKIKNNEALIEMLESRKVENRRLTAIYNKLKGSYTRYTESGGAFHMLESFDYKSFKEAIDELKRSGLVEMDKGVDAYFSKIESNKTFAGRKSRTDRVQTDIDTETAIQNVIKAVRFVPQIEISKALSQIINVKNADQFKNAYEDLKKLGVFEGLDHEINEFLSEAIKNEDIDNLKTNALPAIRYAAEKKMLSLNGLESNVTKSVEDDLHKEATNISYLDGVSKILMLKFLLSEQKMTGCVNQTRFLILK